MTLDDQYVLAECGFTSFEETDDGGKCSLDMTDAYRMNAALKVTRDFELYNDYLSLKISDNILCVVASEIYWFMHTKADIDISADGKTAILTIGDKKLKATSTATACFRL